MAIAESKAHTMLRVERVFSAPRDRVYQAWTNPDFVKQWFHVADDWSTPICEIDLRVGGKYRLGMKSPDNADPHIATGVYREIEPPTKLVFTWRWEGGDQQDTLVTVLFHKQGDTTKVELIHELLRDTESRDKHRQGWIGCLEQLAKEVQK